MPFFGIGQPAPIAAAPYVNVLMEDEGEARFETSYGDNYPRRARYLNF